MHRVLIVTTACALLGGCAQFLGATQVTTTGSFAYGSDEQPIDASMTQYMPWQLGPSSSKTKAAHEEPIVTVAAAGWGLVKGRADVLATFPTPLEARPGRNRTVEVCRQQAEEGARKYNPAVQVEAVSARPERRLPDGGYEGQMRIRIVYTRSDFHEVREAMMSCATTPEGRFAKAEVLWPT
ncbi:hypothetical protein [Salinarimonas soli]|uniref:Lipoprotein n=1 Tax=Salinarimonas soli TaxID=1638099 RepID=A0A5B2VDG1_9HYPH|nr:hypothetical protein [Salinarimonas soli]KAA2236452.1 hypothetical protein F0L46_15025 [Salinarimonas soli]